METKLASSRRLYKIETALMIALALFLVSGAMALQTGSELADRVVRLHVLANSDSEEDQALKLKVRDRVLVQAEALLRQASDRAEAEALLQAHLSELERIAQAEILANGYDYAVSAHLEETEFPTRVYDSFTLPAGKYLALRLIIGEGGGRNWWCVVFPPLCTTAAASVSETALAAGLTQDQVNLITSEDQGYVLKSKAVEWWETLRAKLS